MFKMINPPSVSVSPRYSAAVEVAAPQRWLFISGQVGRDAKANIPDGIEAQAEIAWRNILEVLRAAEMTVEDIVDMTTYIVGRENNEGFDKTRNIFMGSLRPASTKVYVAGLAHPKMLCEIQAVAAK